MTAASISPDGRFLVYNDDTLRLRHLASGYEISLLREKDVAYRGRLTFSPDGNSIFYMEIRKAPSYTCGLYRIGLFGGPPQTIVDNVPNVSSLAVSPLGNAIAYVIPSGPAFESDVVVVSLTDRKPQTLASLKDPNPVLMGVSWSPDARSLLVTAPSAPRHLLSIDLTTRRRRWFMAGDHHIMAAQWLPEGRGIIATDTPPWWGGTMRGPLYYLVESHDELYPITQDDYWYAFGGLTSDQQTLAAIRGNDDFNLWKIPLDGKTPAPVRLTADINAEDGIEGLTWSPSGKIIFTALDASAREALFQCDPDGHNRRPFVYRPAVSTDRFPSASPDGRYVVFWRRPIALRPTDHAEEEPRNDKSNLWRVDADGSNPRQLTESGFVQPRQPSFTPDGKWVVYTVSKDGKNNRLFRVSIDGGAPERIAPNTSCYHGSVSPDGKWVTCCCSPVSTEAIIPLAGGAPVWQKPLDAKFQALRWTPDGRKLIFIAFTPERRAFLRTYDIKSGESHDLATVPDYAINNFAFSPDGKQIVVSAWRRHTEVVLLSRTAD